MATAAPSASRRAYEHVKALLLDGAVRDGELLSEGAIAEAVGVSRTPVREAFLQLEAEGLLELYPKRGALVVPVSGRAARDLYEARTVVESHCLRRVIADPPPGLLAELDAILDDQRRLLGAEDVVAAGIADRRLHRAWVAAAGNEALLGFFDGLRDRQQRLTTATLRRGGARPRELVAEHEAIVAAVRAGDADAAVAGVVRHLDAARVAVDGGHLGG